MRISLPLMLIITTYLQIVSCETNLNPLLYDIIHEWNMRSPTVLSQELPELCFSHPWILCLNNNMGLQELTSHLITLDKSGKQDGVICIGNQHELIKQLHDIAYNMFRANYPMFLPLEYSSLITLRLDSNVIFYEQQGSSYKLVDMFSVKSGPPITSQLGTWDKINGITLEQKKHRWDRRRDLYGTRLVNNLGDYGSYAKLIRDKRGNVIGSEGELQNVLFYIVEALNATMETTEILGRVVWKRLQNGSWTGGIGVLQRMEADICRYVDI